MQKSLRTTGLHRTVQRNVVLRDAGTEAGQAAVKTLKTMETCKKRKNRFVDNYACFC